MVVVTMEMQYRKMAMDAVDCLVAESKRVLFQQRLGFYKDNLDNVGFWASLFDSWGELCEAASKAGRDRLFDYVVLVIGHPLDSFVSPVVCQSHGGLFFPINHIVASEVVNVTVKLAEKGECDLSLVHKSLFGRREETINLFGKYGIKSFLADRVHEGRYYLRVVPEDCLGRVSVQRFSQTLVFYRTQDSADDYTDLASFPVALIPLSWDDAAVLFEDNNLGLLASVTREAIMSYYPAGV